MAAFRCNSVKTYLFDIDKNTFEKAIWHLSTWQLLNSYTKQGEREIKNIQNITHKWYPWYTGQKLAWQVG